MQTVFLGLGSNLGDGPRILREAFDELRLILKDARLSRLWRSKAMYLESQPDFTNAAVAGLTGLSPRSLLEAVNGIEGRFGRDRGREVPKGPRSLDIDILLYGSLRLQEPGLTIPHAGLTQRRFALLPLLDLDELARDPVSGRRFSEILATLPEQGIYLLE